MKNQFIFLLFATIIALATAAPNGLIITASIVEDDIHNNQNGSICETPVCVHAASFALNLANQKVDPCENFYQFACGKFIEETIIPDDRGKISMLSIINDKIDQQLRLSISAEIKDDDLLAIKSMKSYYQICMDTDQIEKNSENELRKILKDLGGCPILEGASWDETNFDWKTSVYKMNKIGFKNNLFIKMDIATDPQNSTNQIINVDQPPLEIPRDNLLMNGTNNKDVKTYLNIMTDLYELMGVDRQQAEKEVNDTINFEIELAKISEEYQGSSQNHLRLTLEQLEKKYNIIAWTEYLNELLAPYAHVDRNEEIILIAPSFFEKLPTLLAKTPKRVLANLVCFRIISQSIDYMGQDFLAIKSKGAKALIGVEKQLPRWRKCLGHVRYQFFIPLSALYVKHYFDENTKTDALLLTKNLQNSLQHLIEQANWMDKTTKLAALEKLWSIKAYIGYADELSKDEKINELFQNVTLDPKSFLRSEMNLMQSKKKARYSNLKIPGRILKWTLHSDVTEANAQYYLDENSFGIKSYTNSEIKHLHDLFAGILQGQYYHKDQPNYMNYGAIGWAIGHELSHAFDNDGSQYDKIGNVFNWWKNETKEEYLKRTKCIIEQYSNYTVKEVNMKINGTHTLGENIADNVGLKAAYFAYNEWVKNNSKEPRLPGLHYTPRQMFWISAAQSYCRKVRPLHLEDLIVGGTHSHSEFRVIGSMSNLPEFSKDFNCPLGSPMNPVKKCSAW